MIHNHTMLSSFEFWLPLHHSTVWLCKLRMMYRYGFPSTIISSKMVVLIRPWQSSKHELLFSFFEISANVLGKWNYVGVWRNFNGLVRSNSGENWLPNRQIVGERKTMHLYLKWRGASWHSVTIWNDYLKCLWACKGLLCGMGLSFICTWLK